MELGSNRIDKVVKAACSSNTTLHKSTHIGETPLHYNLVQG